jgi:hypothetical protein
MHSFIVGCQLEKVLIPVGARMRRLFCLKQALQKGWIWAMGGRRQQDAGNSKTSLAYS